ncbi:hypothetical protein [Neptuniibacter sp. QD37_11]|uniref:hypothetical protein n=1 Tax=Neptuniibacter sp. QD37_11 TaxID=3398209 RepID=UPI0039F4A589
MYTIDISSLTTADLDNLVPNYIQACFDRNEKPRTLEQSQNELAAIFGMNSWDDLNVSVDSNGV